MADVNNIKLSPDQMMLRSAELKTRESEFTEVVNNMRTMISNLCDEWSGQSSQAYYDQFQNLEPSFKATSQLILDISQQLADISDIMTQVDEDIALKMK